VRNRPRSPATSAPSEQRSERAGYGDEAEHRVVKSTYVMPEPLCSDDDRSKKLKEEDHEQDRWPPDRQTAGHRAM
jgi:hypothetical protein